MNKGDTVLTALDPEKVLDTYESQIRSTQADLATHHAIEGGLLLKDLTVNAISLASDVGTFIKDPPKVAGPKLEKSQKAREDSIQFDKPKSTEVAKTGTMNPPLDQTQSSTATIEKQSGQNNLNLRKNRQGGVQ